MAKKKTNRSAKRRVAKQVERESIFDLSPHDEHKLLFLVTGLVFGMALSCLVFGIYTYVGLAVLAIGFVLLLIEHREQELEEEMLKRR